MSVKAWCIAIPVVLGSVGGCANLPVGPTEYKDQLVVQIIAPSAATRGMPVETKLTLWFPGATCWEYDRTEVVVDDTERRVVFKPVMRFVPTIDDRWHGRGCLDGTQDVVVTFVPQATGHYQLEAAAPQGATRAEVLVNE